MSIAKKDEVRREPEDNLKRLASKHIHLKKHLTNFKNDEGEFPELVDEPKKEFKYEKNDIIYQVDESVFAHAYTPSGELQLYFSIEPELREEEKIYSDIKNEILLRAPDYSPMENPNKYEEGMESILEEIVEISDVNEPRMETGSKIKDLVGEKDNTYILSQTNYNRILYTLKKEFIGLGPLQPLTKDKENEDIHVLSSDQVNVNHKVYGMMRTNVDLGTEKEYEEWLINISQRVGNPVSAKNPIVDTTLPDGSRICIIYSEDVSVEGPTLTIRQFEEEPLSIFSIVQFGTMSPELVAYLWLALESNASIAICGETASGKTTSLNAVSALIPRDTKIYTAEDTLELSPPHDSWQRLLTREGVGEAEGVDFFDIVKNALRSRPGCILVGDVRGEEGFNVFQAMQTGHPVVFTFHSGSINSLVNRFTGDPINVPEKFFGNLDIVIFQNFIRSQGREIRRVTDVHEIEGYSRAMDGIVTRKAFERDSAKDVLDFLGSNNSYVLEDLVAPTLGFEDPREIYPVHKKRSEVVRRAVQEGYLGWDEAVSIVWGFQEKGEEALPFPL